MTWANVIKALRDEVQRLRTVILDYADTLEKKDIDLKILRDDNERLRSIADGYKLALDRVAAEKSAATYEVGHLRTEYKVLDRVAVDISGENERLRTAIQELLRDVPVLESDAQGTFELMPDAAAIVNAQKALARLTVTTPETK